MGYIARKANTRVHALYAQYLAGNLDEDFLNARLVDTAGELAAMVMADLETDDWATPWRVLMAQTFAGTFTMDLMALGEAGSEIATYLLEHEERLAQEFAREEGIARAQLMHLGVTRKSARVAVLSREVGQA